MEKERLIKILEEGESLEVEFKRSFHSFQDVAEAICAFANTQGGLILLGVDEKGDVVGIKEDIDKLQQKISNANSQVQPTPIVTIETTEIDRKKIALVIVHKADSSVFHTFKGVIYRRVGSTTQRIEGTGIVEFLRNRQILLFEESIEQDAKVEDIDINKVKFYLEKRGLPLHLESHSIENFLLSKKIASPQPKIKIKSVAILFFAKDPQSFYPYHKIKLVRFDGLQPVRVIAYEEAKGSLPEMVEHSINFVKRFIAKEFKIIGLKREEIPYIPDEVVRETIINALAHRDYFNKNEIQISIFDDRIEVTNPGGLPEGMTPDLLGMLSIQRNPMIYQLLKDYGYMEGIGSGISKIYRLMEENELKKPEFILTKEIFRIILRNEKVEKTIPGLNKRQINTLSYLRRIKKNIKSREYSEMNEVSIPTAVNDLRILEKQGYIKKIGSYKGAYYILNEEKFK